MSTPHGKRVIAYLQNVLDENERLANLASASHSPTPFTTPHQPRVNDADRNPIVEDQPWFVPFGGAALPVHIGDAADAAFATRLRQTISRRPVSHIPRKHYMSDDTLRDLSEESPKWPTASRLRFLVQVTLDTVCKRWHIVRESAVHRSVDELLHNPQRKDWLSNCRLWALIALGEAYSARCALPDGSTPGAQYWTKAMTMLNIVPERPCLELVETYLLLSIYASCLNRKHTAIMLATSAMRHCIILGLHLQIDEFQLRDPVLREHRCRLWWTAYRLDRLWASKAGWPPSIPDECIEIDMPTNTRLPLDVQQDFGDANYLTFIAKLAGMLSSAVKALYWPRRQRTAFSESVQAVVRSLKEWANNLPSDLQLKGDEIPDVHHDHILYMHLAFNQAVIVITRPVLLYLLKRRRMESPSDADLRSMQTFSESTLALTTACIRCARQSMRLSKKAWARGTFPTFDYTKAQFLFSSATILALSALLGGESANDDREDFYLAQSFLHQLEQNGNFAAQEFCVHVDAVESQLVQEGLGDYRSGRPLNDGAPIGPTTSGQNQGWMHAQQHTVPPDLPQQDFFNNLDLDFGIVGVDGNWIDWQDIFLPETQLSHAV